MKSTINPSTNGIMLNYPSIVMASGESLHPLLAFADNGRSSTFRAVKLFGDACGNGAGFWTKSLSGSPFRGTIILKNK